MAQQLTVRPIAIAPTLAVVCILLVGLVLRGWEWTARGIWFDEAFTWRLVSFPFPEMMERAARDNSPPLYYVVLSFWIELFGDSLGSMRALSALCGLGAVLGMYLFVREALGGWGIALFVAALTATSAFQVRYSAEIRPYALGGALAALTSWALARTNRASTASARDWAAYGLLALAFAYTHYYALFVLTAQAAYVLGRQMVTAEWRPRGSCPICAIRLFASASAATIL